jgi:acetyltransferase
MSIRNLDAVLKPRSVALIGASDRPRTVGGAVARNLAAGGFTGRIDFVAARARRVAGLACAPDIAALDAAPDLALLATPAETLPALVAELGRLGTRGVVILAAPAHVADRHAAPDLSRRILEAAKPNLVRVLGPDSIGVIVPAAGLNAGTAPVMPASGGIAFVAQSGAVTTAVLDWATPRGIGFSRVVSLGAMADIDIGDLLDWLANDATTRAILLHVETVTHARKFMSAARIAARIKPVVVMKSGRHAAGAHPDSDEVHDAAFRRAGMLRVRALDELFEAVETIARVPGGLGGERLAIVTNSAGLGVIATDALIEQGGAPARLDAATIAALDAALARGGPHANPIDIADDAGAARYARALDIALAAPEIDAVLVMNAPGALAGSGAAAGATIAAAKRHRRPVLASWVGGGAQAAARRRLVAAGLPSFDTPAAAMRGFLTLVRHRRNRAALLEVPAAATAEPEVDQIRVAAILDAARNAGRAVLSAPESLALIQAYGIAVAPATTPGDAAGADGAAVLAAGIARDPQFGPVLRFGAGGAAGRIVHDAALALPPLNRMLARELMGRTRVFALLQGDRGMPAADLDAIADVLIRLSQLAGDHAAIAALDIGPLRVDARGAVAHAARIRIDPTRTGRGDAGFAIRPWPSELVERLTRFDGAVLRPIRPEDGAAIDALIARLTPRDSRMRFFAPVRELPRPTLARLVQIDYDREMALVIERAPGEILGVVRISCDPDNIEAEFAVLVRSDLKGQGLGTLLMQRIITYARARGVQRLWGDILRENRDMIALAKALGFTLETAPDSRELVRARLVLTPPA